MAARKRIGLSENTRERIKTTMLVERLHNHILGECELSQTQISAIRMLLDRTLPTLTSVEYSGKDGAALVVNLRIAPHD